MNRELARATLAGLVFVVATATVGCRSHEGQALPPPSGSGAPPPPAIPKLDELASTAAEASAAPESNSAWTGSLYARHEAQLGPKMTGILAQVAVEEGDRVKKGELVFRLDPAQATLAVNQAKAALATAEVSVAHAKLEYTRASELIKGGSIPQATFDQAKAGYDQAEAAVEQAKVALQIAERGLADTSIYSPIDGVVTAKLKSVGETVTMMPPTVVLVVEDVENLELRARVPEKALASITEGSSIRMNVPSVGITRDVPVKRINPTIDPRTRTVEVVADVANRDKKLRVGMLVEVGSATKAAEAGSGSAAPQSPSDALVRTETGGKAP
jgi:RND family efflux transporter MFP subunit